VYDDQHDGVLPMDRPLTSDDLKAVRFSTAVRGYRASEVDALLDRLAAQLEGSQTPESGSGTLSQ
jgi:DivIVA domain-containing protein